ncbi:MAG: hypothetical protein KBT87_06140 [Gammaproteobacteria bacterium]|jgi:hypothetical protein|nr:hypothetical protein [Gammaproteobacteria bacterium]MBQ0774234.1 hypothetical protein [Gammaproteobacteria bacterium]
MRTVSGLLIPSDIHLDNSFVTTNPAALSKILLERFAAFVAKSVILGAALIFTLSVSAGKAGAVSIYQCDGDNGEPVFSNSGCENNQRIIPLGEMSVIEGGSAQALRQQAKTVRDLPVQKSKPRKKLDKQQRTETFGQRVGLRKLTMRAEGLRRDLRRAVSGNARLTLKKELHEVERQIQQRRK